MRVLLKITDVFDVEVLQRIQDSFSDATGFATITVDYKGNPITKYSNFSKYCLKVRENANCLERCYRSDAHGGIESARSGKPSIYICHGGLVDLAVPIMVKGNYLGAILSGQVRIPKEEMDKLPMGSAMELTDFTDHPEITKLHDETLVTTLNQVKASADLLYTIANYLVEKQMIHIMQEELHSKNLELMEEVKHRSEIEAALKEADLKALQAQINPHFLFNVLNTIGRLALLEHADKTQEMIYSFSDMMRYTLKKETNDFVTLGEEMEHVANYLSIQKMRLGDRLEYSFDVDDACVDVLCPFMAIHPFVENAINHAIEPNVRGGSIKVTAHMKEDHVLIRIIDDGPGIDADVMQCLLDGSYVSESDDRGTGIGIDNTNRRLKYYFGEDYGVRFNETVKKGTEVVIRLPFKVVPGRGLNV
jgi:two-component system LytT family sensor kinase